MQRRTFSREFKLEAVNLTTLADLPTLLLVADPFSTVRASVLWWSSYEFEDRLSHGGQTGLRRWSVESFFSASLL